MGRAIGAGWTAKGHQVVYGVRDPTKNPGAAMYRTIDATAGAEVVALCVTFHQVEEALRDCGDLTGKILLDPTNPLAPAEGGLKLSMGFDVSAAEFIASRTNAVVVKSLDQVGAGVLGNASGYPVRPIQFIAGDKAEAKQIVKGLVEDPGFEVLDAGPLLPHGF